MSTIDQQVIGRLLVAEYRQLLVYARRLTSNGPEAADLVHMVFARVLSQGERIVCPENMAAWLRTVLFRLFVDLRRREKWEIPTDSAALDQPASVADLEPTRFRATIEDIRVVVLSLPSHYREPYELFTFEHMSYDRIAMRLGLSSKTVGSRINRARRRLRTLLENQNEFRS